MKIANESQWNTDDLTALTKEAMTREKIEKPDNFLLIFKTSRRQRSYHEKKDGRKPTEAAYHGYYSGLNTGNGEVRVVEILSKERLTEKNVLDRLAVAGGQDVRQDIDTDYVKDIALQIICELKGTYKHDRDIKDTDLSWVEKFQFRAAPKITRDPEITRGKIKTLEQEKVYKKRIFDDEIKNLDEEIERLKKLLPKE